MIGTVAVDHSQQQFVHDDLAGVQVDDRLGVENEAVLVEGVSDPPDPVHRLSLAFAMLLGRPAGADVAEHDDDPGDLAPRS